MSKLIDYYDETIWGDLGTSRHILKRELLCIRLIKKYMPSPKNFLDIGCGNGEFLMHYSKSTKSSANLYGLDYSEYQVKLANQKKRITAKRANVEESGIQHPNNSMDVIYAAEIIEHLYDPDSFLSEARRVLNKRGIIVISTPNLHAWYNRVLFFFGIMPIFYEMSAKSPMIGAGLLQKIKKGTAPVGHIRLLNRQGLVDLLRAEGFELIELRASVFEALPRFIQPIDRLFSFVPSLSSNLIVVARKIGKGN